MQRPSHAPWPRHATLRQPLIRLLLLLAIFPLSACSQAPANRPAETGDEIGNESTPDSLDDASQAAEEPSSTAEEPSPGQGLSAPTSGDEDAPEADEEAEDLDALQSLIVDAWNRRDDEVVIAVMGDPFHMGLWRSEGFQAPPREAVIQLGNYDPGDVPVAALDPQPDVVELLGGTDPNALWGPDVEVLRNVVTSGWGEDGAGEAILVLARHPDGYPYFHGVLLAPAGFDIGD